MQNHYNLLYREEEREMNPLCRDQGIGLIPWSPLARGRLARPWDETTARSEQDEAIGVDLEKLGRTGLFEGKKFGNDRRRLIIRGDVEWRNN